VLFKVLQAVLSLFRYCPMDLPQIPNMAEVITLSEASVVKIGKFSNYIFLEQNKKKADLCMKLLFMCHTSCIASVVLDSI
jgi:hypothetical protein